MRRLITVFALAAALFVLMGCGMDSKNVDETKDPQLFSISMGSFSSGKGHLAKNDSALEAEVASKQAELAQVSAELSTFDGIAEEELSEEAKALRDELNGKKTAIEGEKKDKEVQLHVLDITSMGFSLNQDEATGVISLSNLRLETSKDVTHYVQEYKKDETSGEFVLDENGNKISLGDKLDENKNPIVESVERYFGDSITLDDNGAVEWDKFTGSVSFSYTHNEKIYSFQGNVSSIKIEDRDASKLNGVIHVIDQEGMLLEKGLWEVIQELPVIEETVDAPADEPAAPADAPADAAVPAPDAPVPTDKE